MLGLFEACLNHEFLNIQEIQVYDLLVKSLRIFSNITITCVIVKPNPPEFGENLNKFN